MAPGCVTFETLEDLGALKVEVLLANDLEISSEATRAIVVPFGVSDAGRMGLWDIADVATAHVPPGEYALLAEMGYLNRKEGEEAEWCRLTFVARRGARPKILRADGAKRKARAGWRGSWGGAWTSSVGRRANIFLDRSQPTDE